MALNCYNANCTPMLRIVCAPPPRRVISVLVYVCVFRGKLRKSLLSNFLQDLSVVASFKTLRGFHCS